MNQRKVRTEMVIDRLNPPESVVKLQNWAIDPAEVSFLTQRGTKALHSESNAAKDLLDCGAWEAPRGRSVRTAHRFTILGVLCALFCIAGSVGEWTQASPQPNVLLILVDDLRTELGCYGLRHIQSPNIDRLADSGVLFHRAYCQIAVCNPSRISLLTGSRPSTTGIINNTPHLRETLPELVSLPRHFKDHGYYTVSVGKIYHHRDDDPEAWCEPDWRPFNMGTSTREYQRPENWSLMRRLWEEQKQSGRRVQPLTSVKGPAYEQSNFPEITYPDGLVAYQAIHALKRLAAKEEPFLLGVGFYKPHLPFVCPENYWALYELDNIQSPSNSSPPEGMPEIAFVDSDELRAYHGIPPEGEAISEELARTLIRGYWACISFVDAQIGLLLEELDLSGLAENTLVALLGDHGWHLGEQGIWAKQTNFENATRSPFIIRVPGDPDPGRSSNALVEFVDLYPTLCELAGLPLPGHLEGTSLVQLLESPNRIWKQAAFSQYPRPKSGQNMGYSMRTDRYRFTRWVQTDQPNRVLGVELYDHQEDPQETINIADRPQNAELVERLTEQLAAGWTAAVPQSQRGATSP